MRSDPCNATLFGLVRKAGLVASILVAASGMSYAQTVNLTAAAANAALPDGQPVPMWGYACGAVTAPASCAAANPNAGAGWSPVVITVPPGPLTINLTNSLPGTVPTSLTIVGQVGAALARPPRPHRARCIQRRPRPRGRPSPRQRRGGSGNPAARGVHAASTGGPRAVVLDGGRTRRDHGVDVDQPAPRHVPHRVRHASVDSGPDGPVWCARCQSAGQRCRARKPIRTSTTTRTYRWCSAKSIPC